MSSPQSLSSLLLSLFLVIGYSLVGRAESPGTLPGTEPLTLTGNLSIQMHEAAHRDMERVIAESPAGRAKYWHRDVTSPAAYEASITGNRKHLKEMLGQVDARVPAAMERFGDDANPALVFDGPGYRVWQVRWPVLPGVTGEGLLLEPLTPAGRYVIALPDADQTPEQLAGLAPGVAAESQVARRLMENGFTVLIPTLIDRSTAGSGNPDIVMTNQPHREWLHRQGYMLGRHLIGYEIQKISAAIDWMQQRPGTKHIGVAGYGEGGLLALYAAAVEPRLEAAWVSGYFKSRQRLWEEPLYRNVWGLLREFGDAEMASLIAPRALVVEYSAEPAIDGPPPAPSLLKNCAAPGKLWTPPFPEVQAEFQRLEALVPAVLQPYRVLMAGEGGTILPVGSAVSLGAFAQAMAGPAKLSLSAELPKDSRSAFDSAARQLRQVKEIEAHVQGLLTISGRTRDGFFLHAVLPEYRQFPWTYAQFPPRSPEPVLAAAGEYRRLAWEEVLGKLEAPLPALQPHSRRVYDEPKWTGYEVTLAAGEEGFAWGVLLLPKDLQPGEKRPVVVCQHGRHGVPSETIDAHKESYHDFAARLVERGFIVLAPHNLYGPEALYRPLARKGNTVHASMFSVILRHHEQWLRWLATLPNVDASRIGFYGLSYGGESAIRLPPLLTGYALSICSGDFNDWAQKVASTSDRHSFMFTDEFEMPYFNMANTFSYAELSYLMFPRPFMVERGHHDGVAPDNWVASEYAKTRWFYDQFGQGDKTAIEFFNGGHTINGKGTFEFLHRHLRWPEPK